MIYIKNYVFDPIAKALKGKFTNIDVSSAYDYSPPKLPAVSIVEQDNSVYRKMITDRIENAVQLMYEVNVYTNNVGIGPQTADKIMQAVDEEFSKLGFVRTLCNPIQDYADGTIYRIVARYEAIADIEYRIYTK